MANSQTYIARLLLKKITGALTEEESAALQTWKMASEHNQKKYEELTSLHSLQEKMKDYMEADRRALTPVVRRVHFMRKWGWAAAAAVLLAVSVTCLLTTKRAQEPAATLVTNISPGGAKATLTLADGSTITLDSAKNGQLAIQGNTTIIKGDSGKLTYDEKDRQASAITSTNTLATPRGGQYQLTLPDGTNVWLNAASSITFPTAFTAKERRVTITGEAYFNVTTNKLQPFIVDIPGKQSVQVLGTEFNINSYGDEENIQTTLIQGSVKVQTSTKIQTQTPTRTPTQTQTSAQSQATHTPAQTQAPTQPQNPPSEVTLKPGQQAIMSSQQPSITIHSNVDLEKVKAWKEGLFNFNGANVPSVMRELERWYDIHIRYERTIPAIRFKGELDRGVNLSEILKILPELGIRYRMEGRTLIVL